MKSADIKKIRKKMEKTLDSARFEHTLGVTYTAACLAMRYDADITKAQIAGLLHDCAKCLTNEKRIFLCKKHNIQMNERTRSFFMPRLEASSPWKNLTFMIRTLLTRF